MKVKALIATTAIAISGAFAATASAATPTEVTIEAQSGGFFGYVKSSKQSCENDRKVVVYKRLGDSPDPSTDKKVGMDTSAPNGPDGMWSTGNSGQTKGKFYAQVKKTNDCQGDLSPVVKAQS